MWHKEKNRNPIVSLALLLALASTPIMTSLFKSDYALAQSPAETPSFPLPTVVPNDAKIRIDGSASMTRPNEALKERFEEKYSGANVELATNGTNDALKALQEDKIDIAAIGRGLTPEEEKLGLKQQRLRREKIAIIVGKDNPYKGDLKNDKFTKIYRGEITNWSELGGPNKKIRVIDRPDSSDTREAFRNYPLFAGNLDTGSTATQLDSDDPAEVVKQLGDDGIGFVLANQVSKLDNVRILSMHKTLPDDPRYPYSQPLVYVYKENPSEAVKSFIGFATAEPGRQAIETAREAEAAAVAATVARAVGEAPQSEETAATPAVTPASTEAADGKAAGTENETATDNNTDGVGAATNTSATDSNPSAFIPGNSAGVAAEAGEGTIPWWWILLPAAAIGALALWWLLGRRKSQEEDTVARGVLPKDSPPPFTPTSTTTGPVKEPVANTPDEPSAGVNTAPVENPPNTASGINTAGIAAGATGLGLGAAALADRDNHNASENRDTPLNENSPELRLDEPSAGVNTAPVENPPNTASGINTAGIAAGAAGLGLGAAALADRDNDNASENRDTPLNENSPELRLDAPDVELPNVSGRGLDVETPDLQQPDVSNRDLDAEIADWQQTDIPDTSLDLEAPAAVVNSSYHSLPRISTPTDAETPSATEQEVSDSQPEESNPSTQEELPSASTNNWLGNFATGAGAAAAAGAGAAALGAEKIKSKLAGKEASESTEDEQVDSESLEINGTVPYPQLPDVWDADKQESNDREESSLYESDVLNRDNTDLEQPLQTSPTDLWGTSQTEQPVNPEQQTSYSIADNTDLEQPPQTSPTDLWGTSQTEQPVNPEQQQTQPTEQPTTQEEEEESSFSLGGMAAGAAAGLAGAAAIGSGLLNRDGDTSDDSENAEESNRVEQEPTAENQNTESNRGALGTGWFLNRFRGNRQDATDDTQTSATPENSELPEVRITNENEQLADAQTPPQEQTTTDGLPNVWVSQSNPQPTTEETVSEEEIAQFGATSTAENDSANDSSSVSGTAVAAGAGIGAFALGSQMLRNDEDNSEDTQNSPSESSLGENEALNQIANQAEIDTEIRTPEQKRDRGDTDWDRIYGIHHNGATAVPGESNILLANRTPKWAYASWNIAPADREAMQNQGANQLVLRLYDVTDVDLSYQNPKLVQQYECEETVTHRYVAIPNANRDYITEIGYLTRDKDWLLVSRSPIVRVFSRPHKDFWFEADAELIIHGATEPGASVTIDGHNIKVKQDGTFHLRVPFTESSIDYLITAVAPDSEQAKTIHMQFSQKERKNS
ncbi:MAG: DUF4912 domain-containing protein [Rivularia sp. (in: Bacteria)]|nr:DUF4912 domain-containing protein [Rivularia sp. MS3]